MRNFDVDPLTQREMRVYLWMLKETMQAAQLFAAKVRAAEIIAGMDATGMTAQERGTNDDD